MLDIDNIIWTERFARTRQLVNCCLFCYKSAARFRELNATDERYAGVLCAIAHGYSQVLAQRSAVVMQSAAAHVSLASPDGFSIQLQLAEPMASRYVYSADVISMHCELVTLLRLGFNGARRLVARSSGESGFVPWTSI